MASAVKKTIEKTRTLQRRVFEGAEPARRCLDAELLAVGKNHKEDDMDDDDRELVPDSEQAQARTAQPAAPAQVTVAPTAEDAYWARMASMMKRERDEITDDALNRVETTLRRNIQRRRPRRGRRWART